MQQQKTVAEMDLKQLLPFGMLIIVIGIALAYSVEIGGDLKEDQCVADGGSYQASDEQCYTNTSYVVSKEGDVFTGMDKTNDALVLIPAKLGTVVSIVLAAVILGTLTVYLYKKFV